jgi:hypothetical protein
LAHRLSWKETAEAFRTSWEKVFDAVEHVVTFGLEHRLLGQIDAKLAAPLCSLNARLTPSPNCAAVNGFSGPAGQSDYTSGGNVGL